MINSKTLKLINVDNLTKTRFDNNSMHILNRYMQLHNINKIEIIRQIMCILENLLAENERC